VQRVAKLLDGAASGSGGALVVHGEAGIGKSAVVETALSVIPQCRVLRIAGAEFEQPLPFSALSLLCPSLPVRGNKLSSAQRTALDAALGRRDDRPDPYLVGLALLGLLVDAGQAMMVACFVDDAHWLDNESALALAFAARRVNSERVAIIFAVRDRQAVAPIAPLPALAIEGIDDENARRLLAAEVHAPIDRRVQDRIVAEARGNPLALLELPRSAGLHGLVGGFAIPETQPTESRIEASFIRRIAALPSDAQELLVVAAAEPLGDPVLLWKAVAELGLSEGAAETVEGAGLLELGHRVEFRHPLVRSAVYRRAPAALRRRAHRAIATATDPVTDPDRRAWHLGQAALGPDESVAEQLLRSAGRAKHRGGLAAAAAFTARAAELSGQAGPRAARMLAAAELAQSAGSVEWSLRLITAAETGPLDAAQQAEAKLQRAEIAFQTARDGKAAAMLLVAAEALPPDRADAAYLQAFNAARYPGRLGEGHLRSVAESVLRSAAVPGHSKPSRDLLIGLATRYAVGHDEAVPLLRQGLDGMCRQDTVDGQDIRWLGLACITATDLWDDRAHALLTTRLADTARTTGALAALSLGLNLHAVQHVLAGELAAAATDIAEAYSVAAATGNPEFIYGDAALSGWRGDRQRVAEFVSRVPELSRRGEGRALLVIEYATVVLHNGLGDYETAAATAQRAQASADLGYDMLLPWELVEAAARLGRPALARRAMSAIARGARLCQTDAAIGVQLRSRALLLGNQATDKMYQEAIERLANTTLRAYHARTRLVYGEWLRRRGRRIEARTQLGAAHETLSEMGVAAFDRRAMQELEATGEHARPHRIDFLDSLTVQELNVARRAATGATTKEIAAALFLSPRTIDAHMRSIFRKTDITSRRQLKALGLIDRTENGTPPDR
jgi:DNA-binding CsgD family transcriptional regulator